MQSDFISFDEFFNLCRAYERVAIKNENIKETKRIFGVLEVMEQFDLILLDSWGVLNALAMDLSSSVEAVKTLQANGKEIIVISNDGNADKPARIKKYETMGYSFKEDQLINGLDLLELEVKKYPRIREWGGVYNDFLCLDQAKSFLPNLHNLVDGEVKPGQVEGFILFTAGQIPAEIISEIADSLKEWDRPLLVANPDMAAPHAQGLYITPGYHAQYIAEKSGVNPIYLGKPFQQAFEIALAKHASIPRERVLMVGDTLHTDIIGGNNVGVKTMLVESGVYHGMDTLNLIEKSGIFPDFIAKKL